MERIKRIFKLVHSVLWILFSLMIALQVGGKSSYWEYLVAASVLSCMYVFYGHLFLLKHFWSGKKKWLYFAGLIGIALTGPLLFVFLHPRGLTGWEYFQDYYGMTLISVVPLFTFLSWLARVTETLVLNTIRKDQLEKQAVQAELHNLKSQINPHFLFNTLNNIHTLVYKKADTAPEAVLRLSSLMRYMIYDSNASMVPLSREINYLKDYIGLQQIRYQTEDIVDLQIIGDPESCTIAPLLFIHFLENAYKHSPSRLKAGDIQVKVETTGKSLIFRVQNPLAATSGKSTDPYGGIGLPNIKKRLRLLYPDTHSLDIASAEGNYTVCLSITDLKTPHHEREDHLLYH